MESFDYLDNLKMKIGKKLINTWNIDSILDSDTGERFYTSVRISVYNLSIGLRQIIMLYTSVGISCKERNWHKHEDKFINLKSRKAVRYDELGVTGDYTKINRDGNKISLWSFIPWATMDYVLRIDEDTLRTPHARNVELNKDMLFDYSLAPLETSGTITIDNEVLNVDGISLLERECQKIPPRGKTNTDRIAKIKLLTYEGDAYYYFSQNHQGEERYWVDHTDSNEDTTEEKARTISEITESYWTSPASGQIYPEKLHLVLNDLDLGTVIIPMISDQEAYASKTSDCRYFGCGECADGVCCLEYTGSWI